MAEAGGSHRGTLASIGLAVALLVACSRPAPTTPVAPLTPVAETQVKTNIVQRGDIVSSLNYTGDVRSRANLSVVPKASGRIDKLNVDVGSVVKAGDILAELDRDTLTLTVKQNEAAVAGARARLATVLAGARADAVAQAEANARAAQARTTSLESAARPEAIQQAQMQVENARQRLSALRAGRAESVAQADANVAAAQARLDAALKGATPERIKAAELAVAQARKNLEASWVVRDATCGYGHSTPCDTQRAAVVQAEAAVRQAEQQVKILTAPATTEDVTQLRAAIESARQQAELARRPATEFDIAAAESAVRAAEAGVGLASRPVVAGEIDAARAQAEAAQAGAALSAKPFTAQDIDAAQAAVNQALAALDSARAQLKDLEIVAPVDGIVSERLTVLGAVVSPITPLVTIVAPDVEIAVPVEESQLSRVRAGQSAQISVPAFPGQPFDGKVTVVAPTIDPRSRTAIVKVVPEASALGKLRAGMFAQVSIQVERKSGVLLAPRSAVLAGPDPAVMVVVDGALKRVAVKLGLRSGDQVEIVDGLKEGDQVVIDAIDLREGDRVAVASRA